MQRLATLIEAITPRETSPDPEAFAYVLYGAAMQCAYGLAVHLVPTAIDRERARAALTAFIERALFPVRARSSVDPAASLAAIGRATACDACDHALLLSRRSRRGRRHCATHAVLCSSM